MLANSASNSTRVQQWVQRPCRDLRWTPMVGQILGVIKVGERPARPFLDLARLRSHEIAAQLRADGHKPAKGNVFTDEIVRLWMSRFGLAVRRSHSIILADKEWTIPDVVDRFCISASTIYGWIRRGDVTARQESGSNGRWIVRANVQELTELAKRRSGGASHMADSINEPKRQSARVAVNGGVV
jgi:hypothetical protein